MIEPLESRIAPAAILSFTDSVGDMVTVKASKGTNAQLATAVSITAGNINSITLLNSIYEGSDFSIGVKIPAGGHGSGHITVPTINAAGTDLGVVSINGDVGGGSIGSGNGNAVKSFSALSIGTSNSSLNALTFDGVVPTFSITGDVGFLGALNFDGTAPGNLVGKATIGGNIVGGGTAGGGVILIESSAGSIVVKGAVEGGTVSPAGAIEIVGGTSPTNVSVGSLIGSSGNDSGSIRAVGPLGTVTIAKTISAGTGTLSGSIVSEGNISSVTVGQSVVGNLAFVSEIAAGANVVSGALTSSGSLNALTVKGSVGVGGLYKIEANNNIGKVGVAGDVVGTLIGSGGNTTSVKIGGDLLISTITAHGTGSGLGLGSVSVGGAVHSAVIESGQIVVTGQTVDTNATIGKVAIALQANGVTIEGGTPIGISSEISSVTIGGPALNVDVLSNDIVKIMVEGLLAPLTPGANNDNSTFGGVAYDEI